MLLTVDQWLLHVGDTMLLTVDQWLLHAGVNVVPATDCILNE